MKLIAALFVIAVACVIASDADCTDRNLYINVEDSMAYLAFNGKEIENLPYWNNSREADTVPLNCDVNVIAVIALYSGFGRFRRNLDSVAGIIAYTDDGSVMTGADWRCTNKFYEGWMNWEFDDSKWQSAYLLKPWTKVPGIRGDAYWIWTKNFGSNGDRKVFCRKELAK